MQLLGVTAVVEARSLAQHLLSGLSAQVAGQGGNSMISTVGFVVVMVAIFYFMLWRPQQKQQKEHRAMLSALRKGEAVVTNGGLVGRVHQVSENSVVLEVARDVRLRVLKSAISGKAPEGLLEEPEAAEGEKK